MTTKGKVENLSMVQSTTWLVQGPRMLSGRVSNGGLYMKTISSANSKHLEWTKYPQTEHTITSMTFSTLYLPYILHQYLMFKVTRLLKLKLQKVVQFLFVWSIYIYYDVSHVSYDGF